MARDRELLLFYFFLQFCNELIEVAMTDKIHRIKIDQDSGYNDLVAFNSID
jgi:hypothetical protein